MNKMFLTLALVISLSSKASAFVADGRSPIRGISECSSWLECCKASCMMQWGVILFVVANLIFWPIFIIRRKRRKKND
jgi:hypothetical protein